MTGNPMLVLALVLVCLSSLHAETSPFEFRQNADEIQVFHGDQRIATYVARDDEIRRPYFANINTAAGVQVTRNHPPQESDLQDHATYHPGIWLSFGDLGGQDYWRLKAPTRQVRTHVDQSNSQIVVANAYGSADDGEIVCVETCRLSFHELDEGIAIRWDSEFRSAGQPIVFGDQEEMGLGIRLATPIAVKSKLGGKIMDADGRVNGRAVWGKQSAWCDYSGKVEGKPAGLTIIPHPDNFRPSWWHARDYGLLVANPFGRKAFEDKSPSRVEVTEASPVRLQFVILVHDGHLDTRQIEKTRNWYLEQE